MKDLKRERRKLHIRKKIFGTDERPRVFVYKSNKYLSAGVADDNAGKVILGGMEKRNSQGAEKLADKLSKLLKNKKLEVAVFDRSGYKYHGILIKFVERLRKNGIKI